MAKAKSGNSTPNTAVNPEIDDAVKSSTPYVIIVVVVVAIAIVAIVSSTKSKRPYDEAVAKSYATLDTALRENRKFAQDVSKSGSQDEVDKLTDSFVGALDGVVTAESGSQAAADALFIKARILFDDKKYAEAEKTFAAFLDKYADSPITATWARLGLANSLSAQEKYKDALPVYEQAIDPLKNASNPTASNVARLQGAACAIVLGEDVKAQQMLDQLMLGGPGSEAFKDKAQALANRLKLKPLPAPKATAPAAAASN